MAVAPLLFSWLCNTQRDLAHAKSAFSAALSSSSSFYSSSPPPLFVSPSAASPFPQCLANTTTKMVDAMEEYEKEAGCVPILHPEVKPFISRSSATHANNRKMRERGWRVCHGAVFSAGLWKQRCPLQNHRWGGGCRQASDAKVANASPILLLHHN